MLKSCVAEAGPDLEQCCRFRAEARSRLHCADTSSIALRTACLRGNIRVLHRLVQRTGRATRNYFIVDPAKVAWSKNSPQLPIVDLRFSRDIRSRKLSTYDIVTKYGGQILTTSRFECACVSHRPQLSVSRASQEHFSDF